MCPFRFALALVALAAASAPLRAGDVTVSVSGGSLQVVASATTDDVTIDQAGVANAKQFRVTPNAGTTVNGSAAPSLFDGVTKDVRYSYPSGIHTALVDRARIARDLRVIGGDSGMGTLFTTATRVDGDVRGSTAGGRVLLRIGTTVVKGDCRIDGGAAGDDLTVGENSAIFGDVELDGRNDGGSGDIILVNRCHVRGRVEMKGGIGSDSLAVNEAAVDRDVVMKDDSGDDSCEFIKADVAGDVNCKLGVGNDRLLFSRSQVHGKVTFKAGAGDNTLSVEETALDGAVRMSAPFSSETVDVTDGSLIRGDLTVRCPGGDLTVVVDESAIVGDFRVDHAGDGGLVSAGITESSLLGDVALLLQSAHGTGVVIAGFDTVNVGRDISLRAGDGGDMFGIEAVECGGNCDLRIGGGNQQLECAGLRARQLSITSGDGDDALAVSNDTVIRGDVRIRAGAGGNAIVLQDTTVGDDLFVRTGAGNDTFSQTSTAIGDDRDVDLGGGTNVGG